MTTFLTWCVKDSIMSTAKQEKYSDEMMCPRCSKKMEVVGYIEDVEV